MNYTILGAGRMGGALIHGMISSGMVSGEQIIVSSSTPESSEKAAAALGTRSASTHADAVRNAEVVFLCVKPFQARELLRSLAGELSQKLIISVVTGIKSAEIWTLAGGDARIIRTMPNTAVRLRKGMTALAPSPSATLRDREVAERVFSSVGTAVTVQEEDLDIVTAVSGSGPAFALLMLESLAQAGVEGGLSPDSARRFAAGALAAAAALVNETGESPMALRAEITSPGGTTAAGLDMMEKQEFPAIIRSAVRAAKTRAVELSSGQ